MFFKGDIVSITTHSSTCASGNDSRDYIQEAVQYFETRLEQYGPGTEVSSCKDQIPTYHKPRWYRDVGGARTQLEIMPRSVYFTPSIGIMTSYSFLRL